MSLNLIKKNSSSPFHLQRSMVDQGGEGGAYESGGYNPSMVYNNDAANEAVESFGKMVGAALSSRTAEDQNKSDIKTKERLNKKEARLSDKNSKLTGMADVSKSERIEKRLERVDKKQAKVEGRINDYNKTKNPVVTSTLVTNLNSSSSKTAAAAKPAENKSAFDFNKTLSNSQVADKFKNYKFR